MSSTAERIYEQAKALPEYAALEVLDFMGYLQTKIEKQQDNDLKTAQQQTLNGIWDNPADEVWNDV